VPRDACGPRDQHAGHHTTIKKPDQKLRIHDISKPRPGTSAYVINVPSTDHICGPGLDAMRCIPCAAEWLIELIDRGA
jgi:hypothetical protein